MSEDESVFAAPLRQLSDFVRGKWARGPGDGDAAPVLRVTVVLALVGIGCVALHWREPAPVLWALACLACGALAGFLFGIPRTSQTDDGDGRGYKQQVNTNLEQISDWLTKIIIGLGLVEFKTIPGLLWRAGIRVAASIGQSAADVSTGIALVLYFGVLGFFLGYLLTRLYLAGAFSRADKAAAGFERTIDVLESKVSQSEAKSAVSAPAQSISTTSEVEGEPPGSVRPNFRVSWKNYSDEFERITSTNIPAREKIVLVGVLVERLILEFAEGLELGSHPRHRASPAMVVQQFTAQGLISGDEAAAFLYFWQVRNEAVHGHFQISDTQAARVLDLAWRLIRVFT